MTERKAAPKAKRKPAKRKRPPVVEEVKDETPQEEKRRGQTLYTEELGAEICMRLADGESLRAICRDAHMPDERRVREWALDGRHPISQRYARAREIGAMRLADDLLDISRPKQGDDGVKVARDRLQTDTIKWMLAKMLPKLYGDRLAVESTGRDGGPIQVEHHISDLEFARRVAFALTKGADVAGGRGDN